MIEDFLDGNTTASLKTYQRLLPATRAIMGVPNYGATTAKACLQLLGVLDNRNVRSPLVPLTDEEVDDLRAGLELSHLL
jgi:4-hydroxy-tetrahydrodipicolinate synthase